MYHLIQKAGRKTGMKVFEQVYCAVRQIPRGRVASYGQIASIIGNPRLSRAVGYAMHSAPADVPCHRVVTRRGELCAAFEPFGKETHRLLLEMEGISFRADGTVDMDRFQWDGMEKADPCVLKSEEKDVFFICSKRHICYTELIRKDGE